MADAVKTMVHDTILAAKVAAVNNAHAYADKLYPVLAKFFKDYVGHKIEKNDGTLMKRIEDALPAFPETGVSSLRLHTYRQRSGYSLAWAVKTCESSKGRREGEYANYYEIVVYVGDMRDGFLEKISDPQTRRPDYTTEEVLAKIKAVKEAEKALSDARSAMWPFEERDSY